ncbi:DUF2635 domain-containing protein [Desulfocurvus vexinensis]|jgi:hypothetical protein|uniref:DUF2635 domain-containing protein n=1 Tax=Desulfocurvus vexinensis TaxID=399548 RepID=UPI0004B6D51E|nr:DUF2635 domain-containing protein [Desulfocurvus vexinensis]
MKTLYLKPGAGLAVLDPATGQPLPQDGADVPDTTYWRRRLRDGDVARATRPKAKKEA